MVSKAKICLRSCLFFVLGFFVLLICCATIWYCINFIGAPRIVDGSPAVRISRETTYIESPLDANGDVDYIAAANQKLAQGVTPENNAMVLLVQAFGPALSEDQLPDEFFEKLGILRVATDGDFAIAPEDWQRKHDQQPPPNNDLLGQGGEFDINAQYSFASSNPWSKDDLPLIGRWLEQMEGTLDIAQQASLRSRYYHPLCSLASAPKLLTANLYGAESVRYLARGLSIRAMRHLERNEVDLAIDDLLAIYRLGHLAAQANTMVEQLVAYAIVGIANESTNAFAATGKANQKQLQRLEKGIAALPNLVGNLAEALTHGERFVGLDSVVSCARGKVSETHRGFEGGGTKQLGSAIDWNEAMIVMNHWHDKMLEIMRIEDFADRRKGLGNLFEEFDQLQRNMNRVDYQVLRVLGGRKSKGTAVGNILMVMLMPAIDQVDRAKARVENKTLMTLIALKLARYKRDQGGYPWSAKNLGLRSNRHCATFVPPLWPASPRVA